MGLSTFTSPNEWYELTCPDHWTVFEEEDGTFMFMDNEDWKGNLRITAMRLETGDKDLSRPEIGLHELTCKQNGRN